MEMGNLFLPKLPKEKEDVIMRLGFGKAGKVYMEFDKPFWSAGTLNRLKLGVTDEEYEMRSKNWENRIISFAECPGNPNVLFAPLAGDELLEFESEDEEKVKRVCGNLLRKYTGDPSLPNPKSVVKTQWCTNPFIRGAYSYPTTKTRLGDRTLMSQSLPNDADPRLLFAGEATHDRFFQTIHGARLTGIRDAEKIIQYYAKKNLMCEPLLYNFLQYCITLI